MALSLHFMGVHWMALRQNAESVRQLNLAVFSRRNAAQNGKDVGRQDISTDDRIPRWSVLRVRLFDEVLDAMQSWSDASVGHDAVSTHLLAWYLFHSQDRAFTFLKNLNQLG